MTLNTIINAVPLPILSNIEVRYFLHEKGARNFGYDFGGFSYAYAIRATE
jgi:hypothetical protein